MSDLRKELLGSAINKKRVIGVALVAMILIALFAFSTVLISYLFGTYRPFPSKEKAKTPYEPADLILPPYPFDEDFWQDLLDQVDDPASLLDMLQDMFDGNIDELDLGNFSQGLLDLLFSGAGEMEVFRVYDYLSFDNMSDVLWKYECFDEYNIDGWISNAETNLHNFFSYGDYLAMYPPKPEILKIRMPLSPESGINSMVLPTLFPTPYVIDGSFALDPGIPPGQSLDPGSLTLYKDEYNCTTLDLSFSTDDDVNMTFNMFGYYNFLPTPIKINNSASLVGSSPSPEYLSLENKYLQLPPDIATYKLNNPNFNNHYNILNGMINPNDNAFWAANKIRNYLQSQFSFPMNPDDYNPAPEGWDIVDWFCLTEQGLWSDFASAFCAFARSFGIICRFVDGFNSFMIEEIEDPREPYGANKTFAIKYKNLYSWAEVYVPTDIYGNGKWVQFDIFDSFSGGAPPLIGGNYSITVSTDQTTYTRPDTASITATVSSSTDPIENLTITFRDYTTGQVFGQDDTDVSGIASIQADFNTTEIVGPHLIEARYDFFSAGYNLTTILGDISISLNDINPSELNVSDLLPDETNVLGNVYDLLNAQGIEGPEINIRLFEKSTSNKIINAFSIDNGPSSINTTFNGIFSDTLNLIYTTPGSYEVRADLNGTWWIDTPLGPTSYSFLCSFFQVPYYNFSYSSNRLDFNITKELDVWFYINGTPSKWGQIPDIPPNYPLVSRYQDLNLTAQAVSVVKGPIPNKQVYFYDYSRGDILIGSGITDANGIASINYPVGDYCAAGPNLLYARIGLQANYSYFVLNEEPTINIISGPTPRVINRTGSGDTQFNIVGEIFDSTNNSLPLSFSKISLILLKAGANYSSYLIPSPPETYPYQTDSTGSFNLTFGVAPNTPPGNYTLRLDFNGTISLLSFPYSFQFDLPLLSTSTLFINELKIDADSSLDFWINGFPSNNPFNPVIKRGQTLDLTVFIHQAGTPVEDGEWVYFYDLTQGISIGADQTSFGLGIAQVTYSTNSSTVAGPHLIYATWNNKYNYSYFIFDAPINITLNICPEPREINRTGSLDTEFSIHGYLKDSVNNQSIKYGLIEVRLYDGPLNVSFYLNEPRFVLLDETGEIDLLYSVASDTPAKTYTLRVRFYGIFDHTSSPYYPQSFNLPISNFTYNANGLYPLKVNDPFNISISLSVNGNPTLTFYDDFNPPERFNPGDTINFEVLIIQSGSGVDFGTVRIYDVYNNNQLLDSYTYNGTEIPSGYHVFSIPTATWDAGLHYIKVNWSFYGTYNTTYVLIRKTITISSNLNRNTVLRDVDSFTVYGTVQDGSIGLKGLRIKFLLLDKNFNDVTYLVHFAPTSQQYTTVYSDGSGYYQYDIDFIDLGCLHGQYYIRIDFNGSIDAPGIFLNENNFMINASSSLETLNVNAGTYITGNYDTLYYKDAFYDGDELYVYGNLYWDNGTAIVGVQINVTIRDEFGTILDTTIWVTGPGGFFNVSFTVGLWDEDTTDIRVYFYPEDSFPFPESTYIVFTEQRFYRQP